MRRFVALGLVLASLAAACGDDSAGSGGERIGVVATTTQVADLVRQVGGRRVDVHGILRPGADPHDYEPRPSDVSELAAAAAVFKSGGDLDAWLDELIDAAGADSTVVTLIDSVETIEGGPHGDDETDPHWWQDPRNAVRATEAIRAALVEADPGGRATYERNARRYIERLERLDREIAACMDRVPAAERKLVTTHDALAYFADRYDVEVIGAIIPSLSTQAQPSAREVNELVDQIEAEGVRAIFPESAIDEKLEAAVSREADAQIGEPLYTDTLGPEDSPGATYLGSMRENARRLALGMSGGTVRCS